MCYHFYKDGQDFLFGKFINKDCRDEPFFPGKIKLLLCQFQMNAVFKDNNRIKISRYNRNIHKAMIIPDDIYQTNI